MLFQYQLGGDAYYSTMQESASGAIGMSILREMYGNTWTPDRTDAKYAKLMWLPTCRYQHSGQRPLCIFQLILPFCATSRSLIPLSQHG